MIQRTVKHYILQTASIEGNILVSYLKIQDSR